MTSATTARYLDSASTKNRAGSVSRRLGFRKGIGSHGQPEVPLEFAAAAGRRAGHAADRFVEPEEPLPRDAGRGPQFGRSQQPFLGLDGLVQAVAPRAFGEDAARKLIDEHHAAVLHDVIDIPLVEMLRRQGLYDVFGPRPIERKAKPAQIVFVNRLLTGPRQRDRAGPRIDHEVVVFNAATRRPVGLPGRPPGDRPIGCRRSRPAAGRPRRSAPSRSRR